MLNKRNKPLYTPDELFERGHAHIHNSKENGLYVKVDGKVVKIDENFNLFSNQYISSK